MNRRARYLFDVLGHVDMQPADNYLNGLSFSEKSDLNQRSLRKDEMIGVLLKLDPSLRSEDLETDRVEHLRQKIRAKVQNRTDKSPYSELSASEFQVIARELNHVRFLEADDVADFWFQVERGSDIEINGEQYSITEKQKHRAHHESAYEEYDVYMLGQRIRLMILYGLNLNECTYRHSVVLERAHDYGPYKRWKKDSYVESLEVIEQ